MSERHRPHPKKHHSTRGFLGREIGRRGFIKGAAKTLIGAEAALQTIGTGLVIGTATQVLDSATPIELDQNNFILKEITGLDLAQWKSQFGLDLEEIVPNPYGLSEYLVVIDQTHHSVAQRKKTGEEIINSAKKITKSQNTVENVLRYFARNGVTEIFSEGVSDDSIINLKSYREIKQKFDQEQPDSIEYIFRNFTQFARNWQFMINTGEQATEEASKEAFNNGEAMVLYVWDSFLKKAASFIQQNPDSDIPESLRDEIMELQRDEWVGEGDTLQEPNQFLFKFIQLFSRYSQEFAQSWGFSDLRSTILATRRLHIENIINLRAAENSELNQMVISELNQKFTRMQELEDEMKSRLKVNENDPKIFELAAEFELVLSQYEDLEDNKIDTEREIFAIQSACLSENVGNVRLMIFGGLHEWKKELEMFNLEHPDKACGLITLGIK